MYKYIYILQTLFENMEHILHHTKKRTPDFIDFIKFKNYLRGGNPNEFI